MSSKAVKISIVLLCLLALAVPSPAKSATGEIPSPSITTPPAGAFVSTEANPTTLRIGETASVSIKLNNVPVEGYKSAEFACTYNAGLVEKSNIAVTDLFGANPVTAIHDPQNGTFIVAIAGTNSNRATTSGVAITFSAKALQAGQSSIQCMARVSKGDNLPIDLPGTAADFTVSGVEVSPTPFVPSTAIPGDHEHPAATNTPLGSPAPSLNGSLSGQVLASKPVTVRLLDANHVEITSVFANPDGTFIMTSLPGKYILVATASGFLSHQGSVSITAGNSTELPAMSLLAGDVDGNNVIDQFDALTIGMNYTSSTPEAADLNNDGVIDFLDLELLAENYRQTGPTGTSSPIPDPRQTAIAPTSTQAPGTTGAVAPFAGAPLCPSHDTTKWHGLWDSVQGCHYDHEHGQNPFTPAVAAAFPGFDLLSLLGRVEIGHTNPSSPMENTHKHGGMKWNAVPQTAQGCVIGFEAAQIGVSAAVVQWHTWGDLSQELEADVHSSVFLIRQCPAQGSTDYGYVYGIQFQEYGEACAPYQGFTLPYPQNFSPAWDCAFGQYWSVPCVFDGLPDCNLTGPGGIRMTNRDASAIVTSKKTGSDQVNRPPGSMLFNLLFRVRDNYQVLDSHDLIHPFTWLYICSADGGQTYAPQGCRYNNSTTTVHEVAGTIPAAWDNLAGFDSDPRVGRITAEGFVTRFGILNRECSAPSVELDCFPIKLVNAFVGNWGGELSAEKVSDDNPTNTPERDIYFCAGLPCSETSAGAVPSGWIGAEN